MCTSFPALKVITSEIDHSLDSEWRVVPGVGEWGNRCGPARVLVRLFVVWLFVRARRAGGAAARRVHGARSRPALNDRTGKAARLVGPPTAAPRLATAPRAPQVLFRLRRGTPPPQPRDAAASNRLALRTEPRRQRRPCYRQRGAGTCRSVYLTRGAPGCSARLAPAFSPAFLCLHFGRGILLAARFGSAQLDSVVCPGLWDPLDLAGGAFEPWALLCTNLSLASLAGGRGRLASLRRGRVYLAPTRLAASPCRSARGAARVPCKQSLFAGAREERFLPRVNAAAVSCRCISVCSSTTTTTTYHR